jgi:hypothetical protein
MDFLNFIQLKEALVDTQITESSETLSRERIEEIKNKIELKPTEEIGKGQCLLNAFRVAEITNAGIVEGVAYVEVEKDDTKSETFIKHAWNILDGKHFDITKDYVWPNLSVRLLKIEYLYESEYLSNDYNLDGITLDFKSGVDLIASSLRYQHTKDSVLSILHCLGLDKKHHKQLLNECINSIKEN